MALGRSISYPNVGTLVRRDCDSCKYGQPGYSCQNMDEELAPDTFRVQHVNDDNIDEVMIYWGHGWEDEENEVNDDWCHLSGILTISSTMHIEGNELVLGPPQIP